MTAMTMATTIATTYIPHPQIIVKTTTIDQLPFCTRFLLDAVTLHKKSIRGVNKCIYANFWWKSFLTMGNSMDAVTLYKQSRPLYKQSKKISGGLFIFEDGRGNMPHPSHDQSDALSRLILYGECDGKIQTYQIRLKATMEINGTRFVDTPRETLGCGFSDWDPEFELHYQAKLTVYAGRVQDASRTRPGHTQDLVISKAYR
uniref:Uncharacterized protein n=1 Tax=Romanomermis culicivorax TaxID=13658 RepID=A0A915I9I0_ROMCU